MKKLILLSATAFACAASFGAIRAVTPTAWNGDPSCWQMKRHAEKVIWVDFNAKFLDEKGDNVKWMPDHCHPNEAGYREIWLPAVRPYFKEIVGK